MTLKRENKEKVPPAVILAGGLGTRLRAAYSAGPKSMAPLAGKPFLDYLLTWLRSEGVKDVILCVGYKRSQIQRYVGGGQKWALRVKYSIERELLGTGGAVKKAEALVPAERMLVVNGDTFLNVNLTELIKIHRSRRALATVAAVKVADSHRYGSLQMDGTGRITAFAKKKAKGANRSGKNGKSAINAGVYVFEKKLLNEIPTGRRVSLEREVFPALLTSKRVYGVVKDTYFLDIGVPDDFGRAQRELPERFGFSDPR